ncbi:type I restriction-modification system subunit M N-terminal domain-containing protein [Nostoc sp.]|uniref:type I restriction-modification system subunit M N-terminal domain-containing protein n=1 Tax=Nostoc sp. TaxID=1180 RepID=UPI002FF7C9CA
MAVKLSFCAPKCRYNKQIDIDTHGRPSPTLQLHLAIADLLRGPYRPPQYERVMLPMTVLRRFDCVLALTKPQVLKEYYKRKDTFKDDALDAMLNKVAGQRFHNRSQLDFEQLKGDPNNIDQHLISYIKGFSKNVYEIFERFEFTAEIEKMREANILYLVVSKFCDVNLHPDNTVSTLFNGWKSIPLKFLFTHRVIGAWGEDPKNGEGVICIRAADFLTDKISHRITNLTRREYDPREIVTRQLKPGDLIIEKSGGGDNQPVGRVVSFNLNEPALCSNFLELIRPNPKVISSRFGAYLLYSLWSNRVVFAFIKQTTGIQNLDAEEYFSQEVSIPPLSTQIAIANYLDRETATIETLISARERLLDLLAEKRRALITHAVTHGLNPDVSLQNLSFEFFNYIPEHWEVINLKFLGEVRTGVTKGRNFGNRETVLVPYFRVANVQDGYLDLSDIAKIEVLPEEISSFKLQKGDVLMNEGGDADKLGRGAVWDGSIDPCLHQNHVFAVRCHNIEPDWLTTVIGSHYAKAYFESRSKQTTNLASISTTNIKELPIVVPPPEERKAIIEYLKEATSKLDQLLSVATSTIELLHERHTALITAAVTGQISVTM